MYQAGYEAEVIFNKIRLTNKSSDCYNFGREGSENRKEQKPEGLSEIVRPVVIISMKNENLAGNHAIRTR